MNCDQVFDVLTRGPFPTGSPSDDHVEQHLHRCAECRRLAVALRPAIELFEEAVRPEESRGLPSYWGEVGGGSPLVHEAPKPSRTNAIPVGRTFEQRGGVSRQAWRDLAPVRGIEDADRLLRFLGAVAVGVVVAFGIHSWRAGNEDSTFALSDGGRGGWRICEAGWLTFGSAFNHGASGSSLRASGTSDIQAFDTRTHECCSLCHHQGQAADLAKPAKWNRSVAASCHACHEGNSDRTAPEAGAKTQATLENSKPGA